MERPAMTSIQLPARRLACLLCAALLAAALPAQADGFADLQAALARQQALVPVKGSFRVETWSRQGEANEGSEEQGQAVLNFDDGAQGLRLQFSRDTLQRVEQEERAADRNGKAPTPALTGLRALELADLRRMLSPAAALQSALEEATPKAEVAELWNGQPARRLTYEFGLGRLKERDRKYVNKVDGKLELWIAADGTPLASRSQTALSGRAFVVVSFDSTSHEEQVFQLVQGRLVTVRRENRNRSSGAGEKSENRTLRTILLQS
jgi:hypothetical protein